MEKLWNKEWDKNHISLTAKDSCQVDSGSEEELWVVELCFFYKAVGVKKYLCFMQSQKIYCLQSV